MIIKTKQNWTIGQTMKVGFLSLEVVKVKGNEYFLKSTKNVYYSFTPYTGLVRLADYSMVG